MNRALGRQANQLLGADLVIVGDRPIAAGARSRGGAPAAYR